MKLLVVYVSLLSIVRISARLEQGIYDTQISFQSTKTYLHYIKSAFKNTGINLKVSCNNKPDENGKHSSIDFQMVVRSSPCAKEFYGQLGPEPFLNDSSIIDSYLALYFDERHYCLEEFNYKSFWFEKSLSESVTCDGTVIHLTKEPPYSTYKINGTIYSQSKARKKRETETGDKKSNANGTTTVLPTSTEKSKPDSLSSEHPLFRLESDEVYVLIVLMQKSDSKPVFLNFSVEWKNSGGYLGPIDWPLLPFYGVMCGVYATYAMAWLILSFCQWRDLLRIQFWIGAVIGLGLIEKMIFYMEHQTVNHTGNELEGAIEFAEIFSCLKRTLSYMLVVIVSVGFGVVKPRLGSTLHKVVGFGFVFFLICSIEAIVRVSKVQHESTKQKEFIVFPYILVQLVWVYWVFTSLVNTMRALRLRRNEVKLSMYRHFTHTLIFACLASLGFMIWALFTNRLNSCVKDWKELWVDTAFWHILFSVILLVIMILWRPTNNNQRYSFSPLLDNDDDAEDEEDTVFSEAFTSTEAMKLRSTQSSSTKAENRKTRENKDNNTLEDDLKWVEQHIPSSLADKTLPAFVDSDEEREHTKFEISKMQ